MDRGHTLLDLDGIHYVAGLCRRGPAFLRNSKDVGNSSAETDVLSIIKHSYISLTPPFETDKAGRKHVLASASGLVSVRHHPRSGPGSVGRVKPCALVTAS
jgi:hypothetical protein